MADDGGPRMNCPATVTSPSGARSALAPLPCSNLSDGPVPSTTRWSFAVGFSTSIRCERSSWYIPRGAG
jgi:hypothetical protein